MGCCQGRVPPTQPNRPPAPATTDQPDKRYFSSRPSNYLSEKHRYKLHDFTVASLSRTSDELE